MDNQEKVIKVEKVETTQQPPQEVTINPDNENNDNEKSGDGDDGGDDDKDYKDRLNRLKSDDTSVSNITVEENICIEQKHGNENSENETENIVPETPSPPPPLSSSSSSSPQKSSLPPAPESLPIEPDENLENAPPLENVSPINGLDENTEDTSHDICDELERDDQARRESVNSDTTIKTQLSFRESCLSRRSSSKSSIKKKVNYNDSTEVIPFPEVHPGEDDEVFSDSIPPKLPRGDMCAPYRTKRGSIPGLAALPHWFVEESCIMDDGVGMTPPTTPIGRDELALKRHRFFSDLLEAAHAAVEHRVRFDPMGPVVPETVEPEEEPDCDPDLKPSTTKELESLICRLERIVDRLERTVSARELGETRRILRGTQVDEPSEDIPDENLECEKAPEPQQQESFELPSVLPTTPPPSAVDLHQRISDLESCLIAQLEANESVESVDAEELNILPTVISQIVLDNNSNNCTNLNLTNQEENSAVLEKVIEEEEEEEEEEEVKKKEEQVIVELDEREIEDKKMSVAACEDIIFGSFAQFFNLSTKIGGDVAEQAQFVKKAFDAQLTFIKLAAESSAPSANDLQNLLKPTSEQISAAQDYREKHRSSKFFNHLSAISESIPALGWVCVAPAPGPYVKEMNDAGQFYTNRVLKEWKEKDVTHVDWCKAWVSTLTELQQYIKQHHTTGLVWSGKKTAGGAPPPPPPCGLPPPPPMPSLADLNLNAGSGDERSALFAQINQGADITKGLKKVTADMQTHKNSSLRSGPAPYKAPEPYNGTISKPVAPAAPVVKPPVFLRDGKKWLIEFQKNNTGLTIDDAEMTNVVYMFKCEGSTLQIKGKLNSVVIDSCKKCSIVFDSLVSSVEFVNCQSVQMQVLGKVPTISIDKTDGCQMYLSEDSLNVEIVSSKSSEMNVMIPKGNGDYTEQPIPEQFKTLIKNKTLETICVESLG